MMDACKSWVRCNRQWIFSLDFLVHNFVRLPQSISSLQSSARIRGLPPRFVPGEFEAGTKQAPHNYKEDMTGAGKAAWRKKQRGSHEAKAYQSRAATGNEAIEKTSKSNLSARARVKAAFYPKFENEKSDQEVRIKMIQMVSSGRGVVEVSLKHSGSLFLYSGDENGGAFAKNSYGNLYTAVGVFVLGRIIKEAWGEKGATKQRKFNAHLQEHHLSVAMELVTAVLGDHGQRPRQDYVVVTAVADLRGRPRFYSTADVVAFCHEWRLPTNHLWLFLTKKSVTSFFSAYDALCEEGTATTVTKVLDQLADLTVPGLKSHTELQGNILEGLVARVVDPTSTSSMEKTLIQHPAPNGPDGSISLGPGLREIFASNPESEEKRVKALIQSVGSDMWSSGLDWFEDKNSGDASNLLDSFLGARPCDGPTLNLQELCNALRARKLPVRFKCHMNSRGTQQTKESPATSFRVTIHVLSDSAFRRYQNEMRKQPGLWPLYRGFFVDIDLFPSNEISGSSTNKLERMEGLVVNQDKDQDVPTVDGENLMMKLKFLPYKIRTFLIRNVLGVLLTKGAADYRTYYTRQMKTWGTSPSKQKELVQLLNEWAAYAPKHFGDKKGQDTYLTTVEPFLEKYARRSLKNQRLLGAQLTAVPGERSDDEEESMDHEDSLPSQPSVHTEEELEKPVKATGMMVFFPGIPGCAKSVLCAEIQKMSEFGYQHHLMGDLTKGKYWKILGDQRKKKPKAVTWADKNAPNEEVWQQIQQICTNSQAVGVPVIVDSPGTQSNPYALDALAIFMYRVLQREQHPGKLDKNSPNAGSVLLLFYNLYNGKDRKEFEEELLDMFGHVVTMPLLKAERKPLPAPVLAVIEEGLSLHKRHTAKHKRMESHKGSLEQEWAAWEMQLKKTLAKHSAYLDAIQVPLQDAVESVAEQLRTIMNTGYTMHVPKVPEERSFQTFMYSAVKLPSEELARAVETIATEDSQAQAYLHGKSWNERLGSAHITLAHKRTHGVAAVAAYGALRGSPVPVQITALLFSDRLCALEVQLNAGNEPAINCLNPWPHVTVWTGKGMKPKDANDLPALVERNEARRIDFNSPFRITGKVDFV